ncbi:MAG: cysteine hydrolase family protein [Deinococcota bacterium]
MTVWKDYASRIQRTFPARTCALLIVDVQVGFCSPNGKTAQKHANTHMQALPAKINAFVRDFRKRGGLPIYLKSTPSKDVISEHVKWLNDLKGTPRPSSKHNPELDFYGLDITEDDIILEKLEDGFAHTNLKEILEHRGITTVLVCGVRTEICVRRCAERSAAEGFLVFVLRDLCATRDANYDHEDQALMFLNAYTGIVLDSRHMMGLLT